MKLYLMVQTFYLYDRNSVCYQNLFTLHVIILYKV